MSAKIGPTSVSTSSTTSTTTQQQLKGIKLVVKNTSRNKWVERSTAKQRVRVKFNNFNLEIAHFTNRSPKPKFESMPGV